MLRKILSKQTCAACRYCCVFQRTTWHELPEIKPEALARAKRIVPEVPLHDAGRGRMVIQPLGRYQTDDPEETLPCPLLDRRAGCVLSDADKPLECRIWPFRIMERDGRTILALCDDCPGIKDREAAFAFARGELKAALEAIRTKEPWVVQPYRTNYTEVCELGS